MEVLDTIQKQVKLSRPSCPSNSNLLQVCDLSVGFRLSPSQESKVLKQVSFAIAPGRIVGLLGESGCGKTTTALSIMKLLPPAARVIGGSIRFQGFDWLTLPERELIKIRGSEISVIYQDSEVLNPVMRVGDQVIEVLRAHKNLTQVCMREEVYSLFNALGLDDLDRIYRAYPHQLSGGQRRRVAIAQALVCKPKLVIADEPTAWLDTSTAAEILNLFVKIRNLYGTAFLLITHDPETLAAVADEVMVMYAGQIVESGASHEVFTHPLHPYTQALLQCSSQSIASEKSEGCQRSLPCIPGCAPDPSDSLPGCSFSNRCCDRMEVCDSSKPELVEVLGARWVRCFKHRAGV
jgi:oligopeptide transport system ATP-binding protein